MYFQAALLLVLILPLVHAGCRTSPPVGSVVVDPTTTASGQFQNLSSAIASLPNDGSAQTIFMFPGTYEEQVLIDRSGAVTVRIPLPGDNLFGLTSFRKIYGYTTDTMDFNVNEVVITHNASLATSTSDDATGTLRVKSDNVRLYNLDVRNDFGVALTNGQAIALSEYGSKFGAYACRFFSYQVSRRMKYVARQLSDSVFL